MREKKKANKSQLFLVISDTEILIISCYATKTVASAATATTTSATIAAEVIYFYGFVRISNVAIKWLLPYSSLLSLSHTNTHTDMHTHTHTLHSHTQACTQTRTFGQSQHCAAASLGIDKVMHSFTCLVMSTFFLSEKNLEI